MLRRAVPTGKWPPPVSDVAGGSGGGQLRLPATPTCANRLTVRYTGLHTMRP
ncbi:MAG: hypothetical protein LW698_15715 [Planctomycetaceae bacterium]|nr:hypothetical protein [Planctomycetaceae bacterium]